MDDIPMIYSNDKLPIKVTVGQNEKYIFFNIYGLSYGFYLRERKAPSFRSEI